MQRHDTLDAPIAPNFPPVPRPPAARASAALSLITAALLAYAWQLYDPLALVGLRLWAGPYVTFLFKLYCCWCVVTRTERYATQLLTWLRTRQEN